MRPLVLLLALALTSAVVRAEPYAGPPGLAPAGDPGARLLPDIDAPDQSETTPGLGLLRQVIPREEIIVGDSRIVIALDGTAQVTPLYGSFTLRFGFSERYPLAIRRAFESTFDARAERYAMEREAAMEFALTDLPRYLDGVWLHTALPEPMRRKVLFALWDECAESGEDALVEGGKAARALIESYIRHRLPRGTDRAFSDGELAELNRRRTSREPFRPYERPLVIPGQVVAQALTF